jgi:glycosyltransferase involved in cell wall biosynthesis
VATVSFIVPAYNEDLLLGRTLESIAAATELLDESVEVIVVDDASTDRTAAVALAHGVRLESVAHRQISATRNSGARSAASDIFLFVDADTLVNAPVVRAAIAAVRNGAAGGGCAVQFSGRLPLHGQLIARIAAPIYRHLGLAAGCFIFCSRQAFETVGGFNERLFAAEEVAMSKALSAQGSFVILRETVITSGRKLRAYSGRELLGILLHVALNGRAALNERRGLDIWYGDRRADPDADA